MIKPTDIHLSPFRLADIDEVSCLLANSMSTNPNHMAIFKSTDRSVLVKQQRMFEMVLRNEHNVTQVAMWDGRIVGTMTYTTSRHCQMTSWEMVKVAPKLVGMFGAHLFPVLKWRKNWGKHDCKEDHIHFGPIAVDRNFQGMGIGKVMMTHHCSFLDTTNQTGYLETDKAENVNLYEMFGYEVVETDFVLGVENWFLRRDFRG